MTDAPTSPPPLPEAYTIPIQLIEKWLAIPPAQYLELRISQGDLDSLYACIDRNIAAQSAFQNAIIEWTRGNAAQANLQIVESKRLLIESQNALRRLFTGIMAAAAQGPNHVR